MPGPFPRRAALLFVLSLTLPMAALAAGAEPAEAGQTLLEQTMGSERFRAAGLHRQSPDELKVLEDWLLANAVDLVDATPASEADSARSVARRRGLLGTRPKVATGDDGNVRSRIVGAFGGWNPGSVLVLENGQHWRVKDGSSLYIGKVIDSPEVTVSSGLLGGWNLQVKGYNRSARVVPAN